MKNSILKKVVYLWLATVVLISSLSFLPKMSADAADVMTRTFNIRAYGLVDGKYSSVLNRDTLVPITEKTVEFTTQQVPIVSVAPTIPGYLPFYSSVTEQALTGTAASTGGRNSYFVLAQVKNVNTGAYVYQTKTVTKAGDVSSKAITANEYKKLFLNFYYAPIQYKVSYEVDDELFLKDENVYSIEGVNSIVITDEIPVKEGYIFKGWKLELLDEIYESEATLKLDDLYAATSVPNVEAVTESTSKTEVNYDIVLKAVFDEAPVVEEETLEINATVVNSWDNYVQADITVTNNSDAVVKSWKINVPVNASIEQIWNSEALNNNDGTYTFSCPSWKQNLEANESFTFGIIARLDSEEFIVGDAKLISKEAVENEISYETSMNKFSQWSNGYVAEITIANAGNEDIVNWTIEFDFADSIDSIWNANIVSHEGNHYVIENAGYNTTIYANQALVFGINASSLEENSDETLENITLHSVK